MRNTVLAFGRWYCKRKRFVVFAIRQDVVDEPIRQELVDELPVASPIPESPEWRYRCRPPHDFV